MKEHRRSLRQAIILIQLEEKPAPSITALAERVGAQRPSVSRSLQALKEQGLVHRTHLGWQLTEAGKEEASKARATLASMGEKVQSMVLKAGEALSRVASINTAFTVPAAAEMFGGAASPFRVAQEQASALIRDAVRLPDITEVFPKVTQFAGADAVKVSFLDATKDIISSSRLFDTADILQSVITPLIDVQDRNNTLFRDILASVQMRGMEEVIKSNNLFLAGTIDNIFAIRQAEINQAALQVVGKVDFSWVSAQLADVNRSFADVFHRHVAELYIPTASVPPSRLVEQVTLPTATVAYYTHSVRDLVDAETSVGVAPLPEHGNEEFGDEHLDTLLVKLNSDFVEMRHGSWSALSTAGPDHLRHAGVSQRELLSQLLQLLVPNSALPEDNRKGPQIKARMKVGFGVGSSDAEFIEVMVNAVYSWYNQLNKYTHHNEKHEESLRALLRTGEGLMRFILVNLNRDPS